ncbi:hypothetical protein [Escherichia coli]|uniref:hypothetical protein n=1 Tax=Escherichia coli TaxID=562 RepID=UPI001FCE6DB0|nr:hypothetical protein [Escherichia coli]
MKSGANHDSGKNHYPVYEQRPSVRGRRSLIDYSMTRQSSRFPDMHHIRLINGSHFCATNVEEVRVLTATRNTGGKAWQ